MIGVLVLIRFYENKYFYDPFMHFLDTAFVGIEMSTFKTSMFFNLLFRFLLNTIISLLILWVAFRNREILKVSGLIYLIAGVVLFPLFIYLMQQVQVDNYLAAFYVRRFLAHPLLILILLPAFIYYRLRASEK